MALRTRMVGALAAGVAAAALLAAPAFAHVEVEADKAQAGAANVTLTFHGEAESQSAGIVSERVVLPQGIKPADVTLVKAPRGWTFTSSADGFTIAGPALKVGQDAEFAVTVTQLPTDATTLSFKTVETYSDGKVSRWIDLPEEGQPEPESPAPTITLKPAANQAEVTAGTTPSSNPSTAVSATAPAATRASNTAAEQTASSTGSGGSRVAWWIALAVAVIAGAGGLLLWRKRSSNPAP
ncbi:membrane protein [Actinoplanes italicus]|jgi:uncharacterized protein YcnI|uniref:Uncharacterized protein YcnI n=2 Tax=Micromonosporaceae TaxID=28056 RepID=A0A2T0JQ62_9ACTN|nr:uncharacterized protein YcnI [Actinoplanes italicus]GIE36266.1 membrane protein [Actinoplanes italicus]